MTLNILKSDVPLEDIILHYGNQVFNNMTLTETREFETTAKFDYNQTSSKD